MKPKQLLKICIDFAMLTALLLLMTYEMIGQAAHEWLGLGMFALLIGHHLLNLQWYQNLFRGRYTLYRAIQTGVVLGITLTMLASMLSGIILSQTIIPFIHLRGFTDTARIMHMLSAYWGFILLGLHLGMHGHIFVNILVKSFLQKSVIRRFVWRGLALITVLYGIYSFQVQGIGRYLFLRDHFVFFDFSQPLYQFILNYATILTVPIAGGYYLAKFLLTIVMKKTKNNGGVL